MKPNLLKIEISSKNTYCIEYNNITLEASVFLRKEVLENRIDSIGYKLKSLAKPFLQGDSGSWIFIEFWTDDFDNIQLWVDYLNDKIKNLGINIFKSEIEPKTFDSEINSELKIEFCPQAQLMWRVVDNNGELLAAFAISCNNGDKTGLLQKMLLNITKEDLKG